MDLWYKRLELAEEHHKDDVREAQNWELLQAALKSNGKIAHPGAQLFNQINQITKQIGTEESEQSAKDKRHVEQLA